MLRRFVALSISLILLPMPSADLLAQQAPYYPSPQQSYPNNQYDPGQEYAQPYQPNNPPLQSDYDQPQSGYTQQPLSSGQLEQLVAPIALNPDQLIALMLAASTYPAQVTDADHWRQSQGNVSPDQIAYGAGAQAWDPSVKALTAFPQILAEMDQNIQWTAALGNAYYNQPQDVLQAIQIMRQRAQAAGNLQSNPEEQVSDNQGYIQVAPVNPQVVYVPAYNPWDVYGQPVDPYPGFSLFGAIGSFLSSGFGSSAVQFGLGTVLSAFSHSPFGLLAWGLDWLSQSLLFNHSNYYSHSASVSDWGLRYGGPRAYMAPHRALVGYNRGYSRGYGYNNREGNWTREAYINRNNQNGYGYNRGQQPYGRSNYGSNYGYRSGVYNQSGSSFPNRPNDSLNRSYQGYNRESEPARSQQYARSAYGSGYGSYGANSRYGSSYRSNYGSGFVARSQSPFANRSSYGSGGSYQSYRSSSPDFHSGFSQRSAYGNNGYRGDAFSGSNARPSSHSGGFHLFGSGHGSNGFGHESFKAPKYKAPKEPRGFGGGHHSSGGGGHAHSGGGHSHGGGHHH